MIKIDATADMITAVKLVRACERRAAMKLAESVFFDCLGNKNYTEEFSGNDLYAAAGATAAAEVSYRFA